MKNKYDFPITGLYANGNHVLIDFTFFGRKRLTTNFKYPEELKKAYDIRLSLISDLSDKKFKMQNYAHHINNMNSIMKYDYELTQNQQIPTMNTLFDTILQKMKREVESGHMTDEYRDNHIYHIRNHLQPFFGCKKVTDITVAHIFEFIDNLRIKNFTAETAKGIFKPMNKAFNQAILEGHINVSPMRGLPRNKFKKFKTNYEKNTTTFSIHDVNTLISVAEPIEVKNIIAFLLWTGCRPCEVFPLSVDDINIDKSEIYIYKSKTRKQNIKPPKNGVARTVQILKPLVPYLISQLKICETQEDKTLFKTPLGKPWRHSSHLGRYWTKVFEKVENKIEYKNIYKLRSACITFLHRKKIPTGKIAKFAGHLKIATTDRYIQFIKEDQDKIIIDDFGESTNSS